MKETLALIFAALILPLIEAIDRNTAAIFGKSGTIAPTEKPTTKPKDKPAANKEPAGEDEGVSVADLIAHAKSLDDEGKAKVQKGMKTAFKCDAFADLKTAEDRAKVLAKLKGLGATDTREAATSTEEEW